MICYDVVYTEHARKDLHFLPDTIAKRIILKIYFYITQQNPLRFAKKLLDTSVGTYCFRIGDYRTLFDIDTHGTIHILLILRIKHRRDAYT